MIESFTFVGLFLLLCVIIEIEVLLIYQLTIQYQLWKASFIKQIDTENHSLKDYTESDSQKKPKRLRIILHYIGYCIYSDSTKHEKRTAYDKNHHNSCKSTLAHIGIIIKRITTKCKQNHNYRSN